ncbi:putative basic amino acid antiporter YfcC [Pseudoalteromonas sp. Scap03]|uniref:putative basic amino acid antiporter YfcC n=1 Tax=unclassified Pseudoalteromonas TaxID=194690 RepID=UPI0015BF6104|nr:MULTISPECIES: putative basic amino acid antiporter YfcC [unclassified Pseudoalteromonas]NWL15953.1 putative basic amino acid antiporter YfcC [Pseudoalteromonas sp. Scap03]QLE81090.1 putative basic amino acid antiporter YfcC [Pseudoalteromonas sp. Scap25]QLE89033.1 putative basic amino acid antiporter YfcC [Pseudoalteromonas sp. Scap06]
MKQKQFSMPDASIILLCVAVIAYMATVFITPGVFNAESGSHTVQLSQYQAVNDQQSPPVFAQGGDIGLANVLFEGLVSGDKYGAAIGVMAFILITGGAFGIIMKTGAINNGIMALINKTKRVEWLFIPLLFLLFSLGGAVFGMGEEAIAFCIVLLPIMQQLGYDAKVTVLTTYVATQIGFATSWMNPFSIAIAQSIAEIPVFSGAGFRMLAWACFTLVGLVFTMRYAKRIKTQSLKTGDQPTIKLSLADALTLLVFVLGIAWVVWGVMARQYYIPELAAQFFCIGLISAIIAIVFKKLTANECADAFKHGAQELLPAALLVALAKGIVLLLGGSDLTTPSTLNTLLYYCASSIASVPDYIAAWGMLVFQSVFNFFVSSGSGQAAITMPLMSPLGDLLNVSRQIVVLAFQLGDGLTNILIPTSASLIGCLGVVKLDWGEWAAFIWRFALALFVLASGFIFLAYFINYQ